MELEMILDTLKGLKLQSEVVFSSDGDNKKIDRTKLKEAHSKMIPAMLQHKTLKAYMVDKNVVSYIDINLDDFTKFYNDRLAS